MSISTSFPRATAGKIFLVSGLSGGREIFLGKAIDEPFDERIPLEGKLLTFAPQGFLIVRPFQTQTSFPLNDAQLCVQHVVHPKALEEAIQLLNVSTVQIARSTFPLLYRWIESACVTSTIPHTNGTYPAWMAVTSQIAPLSTSTGFAPFFGYAHPFLALYQGFLGTAEQFRRALFQSRQVSSTRELDKLAELEGDLAIEVGKIANQIAIKFHQLAGRENELFTYLEIFQGAEFSIANARTSMFGWIFLFERLHSAKNWARRTGKVALVREINALIKDGIFGLNEVLLEHCNSLDTLVTESFGQYGISYETHGELSPFAAYTSPLPAAYDRETNAIYAGQGT